MVLAVYLLFSVACFFTVHEHYSPEFTESTYVSLDFMKSAHAGLNKIIYDADKEITVFAREVLPREKEIEIIPIDERYLLEVLP